MMCGKERRALGDEIRAGTRLEAHIVTERAGRLAARLQAAKAAGRYLV
jgi:hypothetical protein